MKIVAQCDNLLMAVEDEVKMPVDLYEKCIVFNLNDKEYISDMLTGSWFNHTHPWTEPDKDYDVTELLLTFKKRGH